MNKITAHPKTRLSKTTTRISKRLNNMTQFLKIIFNKSSLPWQHHNKVVVSDANHLVLYNKNMILCDVHVFCFVFLRVFLLSVTLWEYVTQWVPWMTLHLQMKIDYLGTLWEYIFRFSCCSENQWWLTCCKVSEVASTFKYVSSLKIAVMNIMMTRNGRDKNMIRAF